MFEEPKAGERAASVPATWDSVLDGSVKFLQPSVGYRVNRDSVLLASFAARERAADLAVDLGAGVGVVALVVHRLGGARKLVLVEREPALAHLAEQNLRALGAPGEVVIADLEAGLPSALVNRAGLVLMNPPFFPAEHQKSIDPQRRAARHGALEPFLRAARAALAGRKARAAIAYPARALPSLFDAARDARLVPKRLRLVHPFVNRPARLALVELRLARPGGLVIEPPLVEWEGPGVASAELSAAKTTDRT